MAACAPADGAAERARRRAAQAHPWFRKDFPENLDLGKVNAAYVDMAQSKLNPDSIQIIDRVIQEACAGADMRPPAATWTTSWTAWTWSSRAEVISTLVWGYGPEHARAALPGQAPRELPLPVRRVAPQRRTRCCGRLSGDSLPRFGWLSSLAIGWGCRAERAEAVGPAHGWLCTVGPVVAVERVQSARGHSLALGRLS